MNTRKIYSPEVRERALRIVFEHQSEYESQWAARCSIANKIVVLRHFRERDPLASYRIKSKRCF